MGTESKLRPGYHNLLRREILELVPTTARRILDLGCGTGALGKALKERQRCYVHGIELNKEAAEQATKSLDLVVCDNLNRYDPTRANYRYDCIIFADILEHLISPWSVLQKFSSVLSEGGTIIASIPNMAHPWVISQLQKGLFRYEPSGLLDITHLRFFTKTTIFQMFYRAGLKITNLRAHPSGTNPIQYHVTAMRPLPVKEKPVCTILILTCNAWAYTKKCLDSIKAKTRAPYKILVIDNNSTDDTVEKLREDAALYHIENSENLGFAAGFNVGLPLVDTPYFVICNSDIVVTHGWLCNLLNHIQSDDKVLCLGPMSNYVSGPQLIADVPYTDDETLKTFAKEIAKRETKQLTAQRRVVFFCTLFKTSVIYSVGLLDEIFKLGNFEDDDYCLRINIAGFKAAIDETVFIHHYGSKSFAENKIDYAKIMEENKQKFMKKWEGVDIHHQAKIVE